MIYNNDISIFYFYIDDNNDLQMVNLIDYRSEKQIKVTEGDILLIEDNALYLNVGKNSFRQQYFDITTMKIGKKKLIYKSTANQNKYILRFVYRIRQQREFKQDPNLIVYSETIFLYDKKLSKILKDSQLNDNRYYSRYLLKILFDNKRLPIHYEKNSFYKDYKKSFDLSIEKFKNSFNRSLNKLCKRNDNQIYNQLSQLNILEKQESDNYIKANLYYEFQKIQTQKDLQTNLFDLIDKDTHKNNQQLVKKAEKIKKDIVEYKIEVRGIDISHAENKAMHSLQTLMTQKGYYENYLKDKEIFPFEFSPAEYLEAYGVKKSDFSDGKKHFSGKERKDALKTLLLLSQKQCFIYYKRYYKKTNSKGKMENRVEIIEEISPLFIIANLYDLPEKEEKFWNGKYDKNDKLIKIGIKPHKVLLDQINTNFVMKPTNYLGELTLKYGRVSQYVGRFLDLLFTYVTQNTNTEHKRKSFKWVFERGWEEIAINIRLDKSSYWRQGKKKKCRDILIDCYEKAKGLEYIEKYTLDVNGVTKVLDKLYLNNNRFYRAIKE